MGRPTPAHIQTPLNCTKAWSGFIILLRRQKLIFEQSRTAQFLIPMAITVAWGILIGTIFILLIFPAFIMILNDIRYKAG